jgi:hypothetical protein
MQPRLPGRRSLHAGFRLARDRSSSGEPQKRFEVEYRSAAAHYYPFSASKMTAGIDLLGYFDGFPASPVVHRW